MLNWSILDPMRRIVLFTRCTDAQVAASMLSRCRGWNVAPRTGTLIRERTYQTDQSGTARGWSALLYAKTACRRKSVSPSLRNSSRAYVGCQATPPSGIPAYPVIVNVSTKEKPRRDQRGQNVDSSPPVRSPTGSHTLQQLVSRKLIISLIFSHYLDHKILVTQS